ncbi:hypothetical protein [Streptomyces sp. H27-C3]|uniref:hypothetical protein n=1 Tax=Streptomyces sp. H27-C3 TaxID=3046305 RepID=UPI0024BA1E0E|nr:hypothetical protein [Streptomyces sp. H27-C3]MDJ0465026.1 hypothetical protein [Streptomyces sp. H27-C3]
MTRTPDPADELAVAYESDGSRVIALLDPALTDSPLRRALHGTVPLRTLRTSPPAPATDPPGDHR